MKAWGINKDLVEERQNIVKALGSDRARNKESLGGSGKF